LTAAVVSLEEKLSQAKKKHKAAVAAGEKPSVEKLAKSIAKIKATIAAKSVTQQLHTQGRDLALGTSKLNYLDPRISVAWCLRNKVWYFHSNVFLRVYLFGERRYQ
jgi:DNA topoisomerase-1